MSITTSVSLVIPMYNEEQRLPSTLAKLRDLDQRFPFVHQVIMIDDGSTDATRRVLADSTGELPIDMISYSRNAGKGYAIRRGVIETTGDLVWISDADLSTPLDEIHTLYPHLQKFDIVIGSRALEPSRVKTRQPWYRQGMGKVFNLLMRGITGLPFRDTQCGFKLLRGPVAREIFRDAIIDRFAFDVEMLVIALRNGYSVCEVPVLWYDAAGSRVSIGSDAPRMLADTLKIRRRLGRPPIERTALIRPTAAPADSGNRKQ